MKFVNNKTLSVALLISLSIFLTACDLPNPFKKDTQNEEATMVAQVTPTESDTTTFIGKLTDLFKLTQNLECTIVGSDKLSGTTYISGKNMRGDINMSLDPDDSSKVLTSHVISDGETMYMWSSALPTGIKLKASDWESTDATDTASNNNVDTEALKGDFTYECKPWIVDSSKFTVPTDINFMDLGSTLDSIKGTTCSACDFITDADAKAQCKAKLGC